MNWNYPGPEHIDQQQLVDLVVDQRKLQDSIASWGTSCWGWKWWLSCIIIYHTIIETWNWRQKSCLENKFTKLGTLRKNTLTKNTPDPFSRWIEPFKKNNLLVVSLPLFYASKNWSQSSPRIFRTLSKKTKYWLCFCSKRKEKPLNIVRRGFSWKSLFYSGCK